ncbi:hypothetical protein [Burkholderia lata]|uniref:hypothetical protein n=1 Tax=Burkholderia lata (strain ATCC 17760 / DSM 23089 / LMG 22485 / NCIMB 9086 / R18194 / 383) TaxID=482957 RepID=UPI0012FE10EF|nr:hypothetical protein [Burkholderia lata]
MKSSRSRFLRTSQTDAVKLAGLIFRMSKFVDDDTRWLDGLRSIQTLPIHVSCVERPARFVSQSDAA